MAQLLNRKDEKIQLTKELVTIQKAKLERNLELQQAKKQIREEHLNLRKQENELRAKQTEAQLLTAEAGIMAIDLDRVAPQTKELLHWDAAPNYGTPRICKPW